MESEGISQRDLRALKLLDHIAGRFEAEAGFALPCISLEEILPELAGEFGVECMGERLMQDLASRGFVTALALSANRTMYALTDAATRAVRSLDSSH